MKEKFWTIMGGTGMIMLFAGVCAMDSECMIIPAVITIGGLLLCSASASVLYRDKEEE